jgi:hypothetical protein
MLISGVQDAAQLETSMSGDSIVEITLLKIHGEEST